RYLLLKKEKPKVHVVVNRLVDHRLAGALRILDKRQISKISHEHNVKLSDARLASVDGNQVKVVQRKPVQPRVKSRAVVRSVDERNGVPFVEEVSLEK